MSIMNETDELYDAYPISYRFARGIILMTFQKNDGEFVYYGHSEYSKLLNDMVKNYLSLITSKEVEWSKVFYFIECIWPSILLEFGQLIQKSNPMRISNITQKNSCELHCEIVGDTLKIRKVSLN